MNASVHINVCKRLRKLLYVNVYDDIQDFIKTTDINAYIRLCKRKVYVVNAECCISPFVLVPAHGRLNILGRPITGGE
jgi:hypothetical protein